MGIHIAKQIGRDVDAVNRSREELFRSFNAADADGVTAPLADDVVWMGHLGPRALVGKEAVRTSYREFFENGPFVPQLIASSEEVVVSGDWAFDQGTWRIVRTYKQEVRQERLDSCYVMIWRRSPDSAWKLACFIWNGAPVPAKP